MWDVNENCVWDGYTEVKFSYVYDTCNQQEDIRRFPSLVDIIAKSNPKTRYFISVACSFTRKMKILLQTNRVSITITLSYDSTS